MIPRTQTSLSAFLLAGAMVVAAPVGMAQTAVSPAHDHSAGHTGTKSGAPTQNPDAKDSGGMPMGMMGSGGMKQMMPMMRNMMTMMSAQTGMMSANAEGRIASLKIELKVTDAQATQWNRFADALRDTAKSMNGMHEQMMQSGAPATLPEQLDRHEKMLSAHLASVKSLKEALGPLYASFSDDQKKTADGLMVGPMGMM